jgi:hypothetical protein
MSKLETAAEVYLGAPWNHRRFSCLLDDYQRAGDASARRLAGREIREFVRFHPELADLIPGDVWVGIYRVRASGTISPDE